MLFFAGSMFVLTTSCGTDTVAIYTLITSVSPGEAGVIDPSQGSFDDGTKINLLATANDGWAFTGWGGDLSSTNNPVDFTITKDSNVIGIFEKRTYPLIVEIEGDGSVIETIIQGKTTDYEGGTLVQLEAVANEGWEFIAWEGDIESIESIVEILIDGNKSVTVKFATLPTLTTTSISLVTMTSAESGGSISDNGGSAVTERGVCWSTDPNPEINDTCSQNGAGIGSFTSQLDGLLSNTNYYVRAYANNSIGIAYGNQQSFTTIGSVNSWQAVGTGMNSRVNILTIFENDLIAGGDFTTAGGQTANRIARWDGVEWQPMGTGMNNQVRALTVFEGDLIAGGIFTTAEGQTVNRISRWNGTNWEAMGDGMDSWVVDLIVYSDELIAGGVFKTADGQTVNHVARWDGTQWQPMGTGMNWNIHALAIYDNKLIAGGDFTTADGQTANHVASWNGSQWQSIGSGMNNSVYSLSIHNGDLIAGGSFTTAGGQTANRIARWGGTDWQPVGTGMNQQVVALSVSNGDLIAGGFFTEAGGQTANYIARWSGSQWHPMGTGMDNWVTAFTEYNGELIAGGFYITANGETVNYISRWGTP